MLRAVHITNEAFWVCMSHALTTEKEEVMGLLLGDIEEGVSHIWAVSVLMRSDKRKDRVEVSPEQSAAAAAEAEKIGEKIGKRTRVVGWYHSHPHITVNPSNVDINTQAEYQKYMDGGFVGLIFSCFNTDSRKRGRVQVIAFQSFFEENPNHLQVNLVDDHPVRPSGYYAREIPISIVPSNAVTSLVPTLQKIASVQEILFTEERQEFLSFTQRPPAHSSPSRSQPPSSPPPSAPLHPLAVMHAEGVYQKALCRLLENGCAPVASDLEQRVKYLQEKAARLKAERDQLLKAGPKKRS
eukprot:Phypoly_transcript_13198.p1 GENE.Phypoly_transcript_13198~~Phypoly_transcript_13198.p1  ORF type:complete len:297 (+),score=36.50 Phypoly_transcript_13198:149-1039(+)